VGYRWFIPKKKRRGCSATKGGDRYVNRKEVDQVRALERDGPQGEQWEGKGEECRVHIGVVLGTSCCSSKNCADPVRKYHGGANEKEWG